MKKIIISAIMLFCCILFYKNVDAAATFDMNDNTAVDNVIYATDTDTETKVQIQNMVSVTIGQSFQLSQICNTDAILGTGGAISVKNCTSLADFSKEYAYSPSTASIEKEKLKINVENNGIAVIKVTSVVNEVQNSIYFAVNGIDGDTDIYNAIEDISVSASTRINNFKTAHKIYTSYLKAFKLVEQSTEFDTDTQIQHDGNLNIWKITNGDKYHYVSQLLSKYFEAKQFSLQKVHFISEFEGIALRFKHALSNDDMLTYAFYNKKKYTPSKKMKFKATIQNLKSGVSAVKKFPIYKNEREVVIKLNKKLKEKGMCSVKVSGIGSYTSQAKFKFHFAFKSMDKGAFIKKATKIYSGIYNGKKVGTAKANRRYRCVAKNSDGWYRIKFADDSIGYITSKKVSLSNSAIGSVVNIYDSNYSYADMERDIKKMAKIYQDVMELSVLTLTADKNKVYCARIGNEDADKKVIIDSTIHAREWLNSQLVMEMLEKCCNEYYSGKYDGVSYSKLFDNVCFYVIPMFNPDGVNISQYGTSKIKSASLKELVRRLGGGSYSRWKANARGVDLNRNYAIGFRQNTSKGIKRGPEGYSGPYPASERETKAFINLISEVKPTAVVNYHEAGRVIYYINSPTIARVVQQKTGYSIIRETVSGANGSLGDYLTNRGIAWCTPETCSGSPPIGHMQFYYEWGRHKDMIPAIAKLYK